MAESNPTGHTDPTRLKSLKQSSVTYIDCEWGELITGTKAHFQQLGLAVGLAFPGEPGGPKLKLTCVDPRGFIVTISSQDGTDRAYYAQILFPHLPERPRSDRECGSQNGVSKIEEPNRDVFVGTAEALAAAGLVQLDQLPGQPGMRRTRVTILADGTVPCGPPTANHPAGRAPGARSVERASRKTFRVRVVVSRAEEARRTDAHTLAVNAWSARAQAYPRPARLKSMPAQWWADTRAAATSAAGDAKFQDALARMIAPATNALARSAAKHVDPGQPPVQSDTRPTRPRVAICEETRAGAQSLQELVRSIESDLPLVPGVDLGGSTDRRDYRVLAQWLERRLLDEAFSTNARRGTGFIRALAHALTMAIDSGRLSDEWDPLGGTGHAFEGRPPYCPER